MLIQNLQNLMEHGLCPRCALLVIDAKTDMKILSTSCLEVREKVQCKISEYIGSMEESIKDSFVTQMNEKFHNINSICPFCFGCLSEESIDGIVKRVEEELSDRSSLNQEALQTTQISLSISIPPILDGIRLTAKNVFMRHSEFALSFPCFDTVISVIVAERIQSCFNNVSVTDYDSSHLQICIEAGLRNQAQFCLNMSENFDVSGKKRKVENVPSSSDPLAGSDEILSRPSIDALLSSYKTYTPAQMDQLSVRLKNYTSWLSSQPGSNRVTWKVTSRFCPLYLYGRYRKLARDVPQSEWTISDQDSEPGSTGVRRKGRNSVEEIVADAVLATFRAKQCHLHGCGREDIDVRCLGNGRPLALEILEPSTLPTKSSLAKILKVINTGSNMNKERDVEILVLSWVDRSVWEGMQKQAEEKKKGYTCLVWCAESITKVKLQQLERLAPKQQRFEQKFQVGTRQYTESIKLCVQSDTSGLQIIQKTPLRVLHRRSLLARPRYIHSLETALLNPHFFLMNLVTSAGTYVKEFVHGDLGRTEPSIRSLLQCETAILQLDVTWLYDDFPLTMTREVTVFADEDDLSMPSYRLDMKLSESREFTKSYTWEQLKTMKTIEFNTPR